MTSRHTLVGLPHPRSTWPARLSQWSTTGAVPVEFLTCLSADEVRALLGSGRAVSAVLLDGASAQIDTGLVAAVRASGATPIGVEATNLAIDWNSLGCPAVLPVPFEPSQLEDVIAEHCHHDRAVPVATHTAIPGAHAAGRAPLVGVCGPGGTGASTVAMALAQGLSDAPTGHRGSPVVLIDGARRADLAAYHDVGDIVPGLPELLDDAQRSVVDPAELGRYVFRSGRGYHVLLGQRRAADWTELSPTTVGEALRTARRGSSTVVVDHDGDLERVRHGADGDLERRNAVSLVLAQHAELWFVVSGPGMKGLHDAVRSVDEAADAGVPPQRIQVVFNRFRRSPAARSAATSAFARLTTRRDGSAGPPVFIGDLSRLEATHRDATALPRSLVEPLTATVRRLLGHLGARNTAADGSFVADTASAEVGR